MCPLAQAGVSAAEVTSAAALGELVQEPSPEAWPESQRLLELAWTSLPTSDP